MAITRKSRNSLSGEFRAPSYRFLPFAKIDNSEFYCYMLRSENSEFRVIVSSEFVLFLPKATGSIRILTIP